MISEELTVEENTFFIGRVKGIADDAIGLFIGEMFGYFDLERVLRRRVGDLVLGRRRALISVLALMGMPDILILDEPTVGMDRE